MDTEWIEFVERTQDPKKVTREWLIQRKDDHMVLGEVRWYAPWRRFAFFPWPGTIWEQDCLRVVGRFIERATLMRKQERASEKVRAAR